MSVNPPNRIKIEGLLFDKDGTLFDFHATWSTWTGDLIQDLSGGDAALADDLVRVLHYDLATGRLLPSSPVIAHTHRQVSECVAAALPGRHVDEIEHELMITSSQVPQVATVPLHAFLDGLAARGLALGVMTNDSDFSARAHLGRADVVDKFDFIAGFDSGYGSKPDPDPLLAFAKAMGLDPRAVAMVGDSAHDLIAGRAAEMHTVGVLTGVALEDDLAPHADVVFPDIGHIPAWLDA